ncbi:MAG: hypothetical protein ABSE58_07500 [Candidatus Limnocylindrales bacterium]|jgi:hypothetical protein
MTTPNLPPRDATGWGLRPIEEVDVAGYASGFDLDGDLSNPGHEDYETGLGDRFRALAGRALVRTAWLVLAAALALGSAGIVAAVERSPSTGTRPELTWGADQALSTRLNSAVRDLTTLKDDVDALGQEARNTLSSLAQVNQAGLQSAWDRGSNDLSSIDSSAANLSEQLQCGSWDTSLQDRLIRTNSPAIVDRYHQVCIAIASVSPLHDDWQAMVSSSKTAIQVANDIENHDSMAAEALQLATAGRYPDALAKMTGASQDIADASSIAAYLAKVTDVSTLTEWLDRTTQMDNALTTLWQAMVASKGVVTKQVTAALKNVNDAEALLPNDSSVMQVVLYEVAGDLTSHGISIETARGALANALTALVGGTVFGA